MQTPKLSSSREASLALRTTSLFCLSFLATAVSTVIAWILFPNFITTPSAVDVIMRYELRVFPKPEPIENASFIFAWIFGTFSIALASYLSASDYGKKLLSRVPKYFDFIVIAFFYVVLGLWLWRMDWTSLLPPSPSALINAVLNHRLGFIGSILFILILYVLLNRYSRLLKSQYAVLIIAIAPLAYLSRLVISSSYDDTTFSHHYQLLAHPIVQAYLGSGIYLSQQALYGFYPTFLIPLWQLLGPPTTTLITLVMASLLFFANVGFLIFMFRFNHYKGLSIAFTLLAIIFTLMLYPFWPGDSYFQFFPLRLVFPAIALILMCFRVTSVRASFVSYLVLSFGVFWNFESGMIALVSFGIFALLVEYRPEWRHFGCLALRQAGMALSGIIIAFIVLSGYYWGKFGAFPDWGGLTKYIRIYSSGAYAEPMPMWGAWIIPVIVYCCALFVGLRSLFSPHSSRKRGQYAALLAITVMGMLFFKYYQNRSVPLQLIFASWPTFLCLGFLIDIGLSRRLCFAAPMAKTLALVIAVPLMSAFFLYSISNPIPNRGLSVIFEKGSHSPNDDKVAIIEGLFSQVQHQQTDEVLVIAPYVDLFSLKIGKPNPISSPNHCIFEFQKDIRDIVAEIRKETTRMVIFDANNLCNHGVFDDEAGVTLAVEKDFQPIPQSCSRLGPYFRAFVRRDSAGAATVPDPRPNLARGKPATQSSQFGLTGAAVAVDDKTDGNYVNGSVTHTLLDKNAWWDVDLGTSAAVASIVIWNRTDFGSERLQNYWVFVSDTPFGPSDTPATIKDRAGVSSSFQATSPCPSTRIKTEKSHGRYLRIQLAGEGYLSLAEVQVFGVILP